MIYVIEAVGLDRVKIGKSVNPLFRMLSLQSGCPVPLRIVKEFDWHDSIEKIIHSCFGKYRIGGEWFRTDGEINELGDFLNILVFSDEQSVFDKAMEMLASLSPDKVMNFGKPFDRVAYQKEYIKEYMRKRRAESEGEE